MQVKRIIEELKISNPSPTKVYFANKAAISIAYNPVLNDKTKYVKVDKHFIKEKIDNGQIYVIYIPTIEQIVHVLTKGLTRKQLEKMICKLAMEDIFKPA